VTTVEEFVGLLRDQLGLDVTADDLATGLDRLPGWDSVQLLSLCTTLERETGRGLSLPDVLDASSLGRIYELAVTA
jgi:acyl carrier protein